MNNLNNKSVLFVVDYGLDSPNSVGQILRNIVYNKAFSCYKKTVFLCGNDFVFFNDTIINGIHQIQAKNKPALSAFKRRGFSVLLLYVFWKIIKAIHRGHNLFYTIVMASNLKFIKRKYNIGHAFYLTSSPDKYAINCKIPYSYFLYDTFLERPGISDRLLKIEKK